MKYEELLKKLKNKEYSPVYFLDGEEPFYIDRISDYIAGNILDEAEKEFNQSVYYGRDINTAELIAAAKRFPMMAQHQVIIVKEAQHLKKIEELESYLKNPLSSTILVLNYKYKKLDKRKAFGKLVQKAGVYFTSDKVKDYQLPKWIESYTKQQGFQIDTPSSQLLAENLGTDLSKIARELEKLEISLPKGSKIDKAVIEKHIGISRDYNNFELNNAIMARDIAKANKIALHFGQNPKNHPLVVIISSFYGLFSKIMKYHYLQTKNEGEIASALKIHPFFVKDYSKAARIYKAKKTVENIAILREFDLKSKGLGSSTSSEGDLIKELVYRLMH